MLNLNQLTPKQIKSMQNRIKKEIFRLGKEMKFMRIPYTSDDIGGYIAGTSTEVFKQKGILTTPSKQIKVTVTEGAKDYTIDAKFIMLYDESKKPKLGDTFEDTNYDYTIEGITNISELNIFIVLELSRKPKKVKTDE